MYLSLIVIYICNCLLQVIADPQISGPCQFKNNNYVIEGTIVNCTCEDTDAAVTDVYWDFLKQGPPIHKPGNEAGARLDVVFTRKYNTEKLACVTVHNETKTINFTILIAYGPDNVSIEVPSSTIDFCPSCNIYYTVKCNPTHYNPNVNNKIYVNGTLLSAVAILTNKEVNKGGLLNIVCESSNTIASQNVKKSETVVTVREAPTSPPILFIDGKQVSKSTTVHEGKRVINCWVVGGYPQVSNVTIQCGKRSPITEAKQNVSTAFDFTRDLNQASCSCWASHVTGFYTQRTNVLLNVQYSSKVTVFTINGTSNERNVTEGALLDFVCEGNGNPEPKISIEAMGNNVLWRGMSKVVFNKEMQCNDTDNYTCQAESSLGTVSTRQIQITVVCPVATDSPNIIVAIVVPIVIVFIAIVIAIVIAVFIQRKRSRAKTPTPEHKTPDCASNYVNVIAHGTHLSGSYNSLDSAADAANIYGNDYVVNNSAVNNSNTNNNEHTDNNDHIYNNEDVDTQEHIYINVLNDNTKVVENSPFSSNNSKVSTGKNIKNIRSKGKKVINKDKHTTVEMQSTSSSTPNSEETRVKIIPVSPHNTRKENVYNNYTDNEWGQPPDIPKKKGKPAAPLKKLKNNFDIPKQLGQSLSSEIDKSKPPPVPVKPKIYENLKPRSKPL